MDNDKDFYGGYIRWLNITEGNAYWGVTIIVCSER